ncbi:hypothetical protein C8T65DRAFT_658093 [Cerioporus squamosus]|nr:hypothetical protein C8T65DRAFT_658093 [Cerioporus squamosus]
MVHRPSDSRLLTNLLNHEKDYSKHLNNLLDYSQAALASFSAYARRWGLSGADDALRNYAAAVERWQEQLKALKTMEDDVGNIVRDREILVTRLIKASKQQKPTRDSMNGSPSGSSLSIPKREVEVGQKMSVAQAELQACEAHLAVKEQELNAFRTNTIRSGLQARCKAMVECGWAWGEMGKEGMRALETLDMPNGHGSPLMYPYMHKPLPGYEKASSDVSSIAPSHVTAGSVTDHAWRSSSPPPVPTAPKPYTLQIPPAHSISEFALPNGTAQPTIYEETGGSSAEEERKKGRKGKAKPKDKEQPKPVPAAAPSRHISFSLRAPKGTSSEINIPASSSLRSESPSKRRGVLGSLAGLFHIGHSRTVAAEDSPSGSPSKQGRWQTRIDRNLASARRGKNDESSDDEVVQTYAGPSSPRQLGSPGTHRDARLKKRPTKRGSVQVQPTARVVADTEKGYASDTVAESISKSRKVKKPNVGGSVRMPNGSPVAGPSGYGRPKKSPAVNAVLASEGETSLSRNSSLSKQSMISTASAPPRTNLTAASARHSSSSPPRKRTASLNVEPSTPKAGSSTPSPAGHKRTMSTSATPTPTRSTLTSGEPSLMSIVEGISRMNKQAVLQQDPNRLLVVPKAPGPINIALSESLGELPVIRTSPPRSEGSPPRRPPKDSKTNGKQSEENNYRDSLLLSASVSAPSLTLPASTSTAGPSSSQSKHLPTPAKMPLRSALRNGSGSRTPSPNPPAKPLVDGTRAGSPSSSSSGTMPTPVVQPVPVPAAVSVPAPVVAATLTAERPTMTRRESDISSISSYETGHENFESEPDSPVSPPTPTQAPSPPPASGSPPPLTQSPQHTDGHFPDGSEVSHSTGSTILIGPANGDQPPRRRKSVRMSLPPTFSATPPAIEDTDEDDAGKHAPWSSPGGGSIAPSSSWGTRTEANGARDVWADSSDEDAEYSTAKRMLSRFSRKLER